MTASSPGAAAEQPQHPRPSERARAIVRGGYDLHIHVGPDVMPRRITDLELAQKFHALGLAGFAIKSHYTSTAERAAVVRAAVPGVNVRRDHAQPSGRRPEPHRSRHRGA